MKEDTPEVLHTAAYEWDDKSECALLLSNGDWVFRWTREEGKAKVDTTVKLSPTAMLATMKSVGEIIRESGKPLGWEPENNEKH